MRLDRVSACVFTVATSLAGCFTTGDVEYAGDVRVRSPGLVEISPGVSVVADADEPLFYSDGHYWLYRDGSWLRSDDYRRGFARVTYMPARLRRIEHPQTYAQYRRYHGRNLEARNTSQPRRMSEPPPLPTSSYPANAKSSPGPHHVPRELSPNDTEDWPQGPRHDEERDRKIDEENDTTRSDE